MSINRVGAHRLHFWCAPKLAPVRTKTCSGAHQNLLCCAPKRSRLRRVSSDGDAFMRDICCFWRIIANNRWRGACIASFCRDSACSSPPHHTRNGASKMRIAAPKTRTCASITRIAAPKTRIGARAQFVLHCRACAATNAISAHFAVAKCEGSLL